MSTLEVYKWFVAKEKAIYNCANHLKDRQSTYVGFLWAPDVQETMIKQTLQQFPTTEFNRWNYDEKAHLVPPTYIKSNDVIAGHQMMVNMYNVPTYKELNPAVFSIVTYPFLFSVMYGDWGHGFIFLMPALALLFMEPSLRNSVGTIKMVLAVRYILLTASLMTIFHGLIYNEFFAISNDFFGSCYKTSTPLIDEENPRLGYERLPYNDPNQDCVYPFGMDPAWSLSSNQKLGFMNTNKEKLSVIIAFFHLNIGVICKGLNAIYFGRWKVLIFDVFTGIFIFFGIIGVMIVSIYAKWWYPVNAYAEVDKADIDEFCNVEAHSTPNVCTSPSIITVTINNFMQVMGSPNPPETRWFPAQQTFADIFVVIGVICIPCMLCCIPCLTLCNGKQAVHEDEFEGVAAHNGNAEEEAQLIGDKDVGVKEFEEMLNGERRAGGGHGGETFGDAFIWQMVETIEFTLGTISCTASYLRLWALSLAHGQLGEVFAQMSFRQLLSMIDTTKGLHDYPTGFLIPYLFIMGFVFMFANTAVLFIMDILEVALHTLRLHWVEFMKQFFDGKGYQYTPFSFNSVYEKEMERSDAPQN